MSVHPIQPAHLDVPLGLTVHAVSVPASGAPSPSGRWKMIAVLLVCAAPVVLSYFTYYVIRPEGRRNYGELLVPQKPLPAIATIDLKGQASVLTALKGQWLLISVANAACDVACQQRLYFTRQMREALGKEKGRVDWVWLINDNTAVDQKLQQGLSAATLLRVQPDELARWLVAAPGQKTQDHVFVVDPLGNLMMRFPADMDAAGAAKAKRDLDRLLRASGSWDKEGR